MISGLSSYVVAAGPLETPCWVWQGAKVKGGYGFVRIDGRPLLAHRVSWAQEHGPIPDGLCVLHECDNPPCINPAHLHLGTRADNNAEKVARGRQSSNRGECNPRARLTTQDVREIRAANRRGESQRSLAERYGVARATISFAIAGRNWAVVE